MRINSSLRRHSIPQYRGVETGLGALVGSGQTRAWQWPDGTKTTDPDSKVQGLHLTIQKYAPQWEKVFTAPDPIGSIAPAPPYVGLSNQKFAPSEAPQIVDLLSPILNPHTTTALSWLTGGPILNIGAPRSIYDPYEYLRSALIDSDWDRVTAWFAFYISKLWDNVSHAHSAFYSLSQLNLASYKYVVNADGSRTYYPLSFGDINAFVRKVMAKLRLVDTGRQTAVFGFLTPQGGPLTNFSDANVWNAMIGDIAGGLQGGGGGVYNQLNLTPYVNSMKASASPLASYSIGWVRGPDGPWDYGSIMKLILIAAVSYGIGSAISVALSAANTASTGISTASSAGEAAGAGTIAATSAPAIIAPVASTALQEIVVTASLAPAISTAGAIAGTVAAAGAAGVIAGTASAPAVSTPVLQEIVVTASPAAPVSTVGVAAGVAGAVVPIATAPAIVAAGAETPPLQEIVVTGTPNAPAPISLPTATVSLVDAGIGAALANPSLDIQSPNLPELNDPDAGSASWWERLLQTYGSNYIRSHLNDIMCRLAGHCPSQAQLDAQDQYLQTLPSGAASGLFGSGNLLWVIAAAVVGLAVVLPEKKQKTHRRAKHRLLGVRRK